MAWGQAIQTLSVENLKHTRAQGEGPALPVALEVQRDDLLELSCYFGADGLALHFSIRKVSTGAATSGAAAATRAAVGDTASAAGAGTTHADDL